MGYVIADGQPVKVVVRTEANMPNLRFFETVHVPAYIATPRELSELGKSTWTPAGLKD